MSITKSISIVIPTYNEAERLPPTLDQMREFLSKTAAVNEVLIVDDGSTDQTLRLLREAPAEIPLRVISYGENAGKGYAIRLGILEATSEAILISDADLSTPLDELSTLERYLDEFDIVIGSRALDPSRVGIRQAWYRQAMGQTFNQIMRRITGLPFRDTQCGFKLFRADPAREIFREAIVDRFAFDVEILVLALKKGYSVAEVPVSWFNVEGSRVSIGRDSVRMLIDTIRTRARLGAPPIGKARLVTSPYSRSHHDERTQESHH